MYEFSLLSINFSIKFLDYSFKTHSFKLHFYFILTTEILRISLLIIYQTNQTTDFLDLFYLSSLHHLNINILGVENRSELSSNESESSDSEYSWRKIKISKGDSAEDIKTSSNDFLSSLSANTILEGKWQNLELSSLISTVDSYGFYPEISASSNPASNPTPSVYSMLTEDQKLTKLFDVIGQINDGGKYLWRFEKESSKYN